MLWWIAEAARMAREEADPERLQVDIASVLRQRESTIYRFEAHQTQPRDLDATVRAYAAELGIEPQDIWLRALSLWGASDSSSEEHADRAVRAATGAARGRSRSPRQSDGAQPSKVRRRAAG
jgi:predicted TPR repeat methyltransferase